MRFTRVGCGHNTLFNETKNTHHNDPNHSTQHKRHSALLILSITTPSIVDVITALRINDSQHNDTQHEGFQHEIEVKPIKYKTRLERLAVDKHILSADLA
jgi:hypothetical protein